MKRIAFLMLLIAAAAYADDPPVGNYWCAVIILAGPPQQPVPPVQPPCIPCKQNAKGSPAYVGTGSYETDATDLTMPTAGLSLTVSRSYESSRPHDGILGVGWTLSLSARLYYASYLFSAPSTYAHEADIVLPDGSHYRFIENTDGTYTPPLSIYDTLTKNGDGSFDLVTADGSVHYHFGLGGRIDTIGDEFGNTLTFTYDTNNRLQQAADGAGSGRYVDVFYGADGRVSTIQDHTGRQIQFAYDPTAGTLTSVTDPIGRKTNYTYQQVRYGAMLTRIADNWGRVITDVTYDANGRVHSYTEEGETYTYTYNYNNNANQTAKVDSMGNQWVYTFTTGGPITDRVYPGGASTHVIYKSDFTIQQSTDETGVITSYTYGPNGRVASVTRDVGGPQTVRYDYTYDPAFPAKVTAITPKSPSTGNYDPNWQATDGPPNFSPVIMCVRRGYC
jgi:YD repeat-containing protein